MSSSEETRQLPAYGRAIVALALVTFLILQGKTLLGTDGIMDRHGFWDGFAIFNNIMMSDPVTVAGLIDMVTMLVFMIVVIANGLPRGPLYPVLLVVSIVVALVYPGLTALLFLLLYWRRLGQFRP